MNAMIRDLLSYLRYKSICSYVSRIKKKVGQIRFPRSGGDLRLRKATKGALCQSLFLDGISVADMSSHSQDRLLGFLRAIGDALSGHKLSQLSSNEPPLRPEIDHGILLRGKCL